MDEMAVRDWLIATKIDGGDVRLLSSGKWISVWIARNRLNNLTARCTVIAIHFQIEGVHCRLLLRLPYKAYHLHLISCRFTLARSDTLSVNAPQMPIQCPCAIESAMCGSTHRTFVGSFLCMAFTNMLLQVVPASK